MKKFIGYLLLIIVCAAALITTIVWLNRVSIISSTLTKEFGVPVSLKDIEVSIHGVTIEGLHIANPSGSTLPTAFSAEQIKVGVSLTKLFGNNVVIDLVQLDDILFGIEIYDTKNNDTNWNRILANMPKGDEAKSAPEESNKPAKHITISLLAINNLQMQMFNHNLNTRPVDLEPITHKEFTNVSSEGGNQQFAQFLLKEIIEQLSPLSGMKNLIQNTVKMPFKLFGGGS